MLSKAKLFCFFQALAILGLGASQKNNIFQDRTSIPRYNVRLDQTSVSGFSSGAFFANQFLIAHSSFLRGAGLVAGGQYACIKNHLLVTSCAGPIYSPTIASRARDQVMQDYALNKIDPPSNIKNRRIMIVSGKLDLIVRSSIQERELESFKLIINSASSSSDYSNLKFQQFNNIGHNFQTDIPSSLINPGVTPGGTCEISKRPYIAYCEYDTAGEILKHIYGTLNPRNNNINRSGKFLKFPQSQMHPDPESIGLGPNGYLYVPNICENPANQCRLHIAFHGCGQSEEYETFARQFITETGYAEWADTNRLIIAFPQTTPNSIFSREVASPGASNRTVVEGVTKFMACWDFFGNYGTDYQTRNGAQVKAIRQMINKIVRLADAV